MDRIAHRPVTRRPDPTSAPTHDPRRLPAWSELGLGADDPDFDPDWCPAVLTGAAWQSRPQWWRAWRALRRHLRVAPSTVGVVGVVLLVLASLGLVARVEVAGPRDPAPARQAQLESVRGGLAVTSSPTEVGGPGSSVAMVPTPTPTPGVKVVYAGPPPPRLPVRLDEPVLYWLPEIRAASTRTGVPAALIAGVIKVESQGNPAAVSPAGARGLMQVMPHHLEEQGIDPSRWHDPATNIHAGALLLKWKIESAGNEWDGVRTYFGADKCDAFTCTEEYVTRVYAWQEHYAPLIANPNSAGVRIFPEQ